VDRVRDAADIVRVVSEYVALKPAGHRFKGLCPFHQEKTPSFSVDPEAKLYYCFGCQAGGDLFKFVQQYDNVSFPEAVETLAERCGVALPQDRPKTPEERARERALEIHAVADAYYRTMLVEPVGRRCREYLERRGLSSETLERLGVGYAPAGWEHLSEYVRRKNIRPQELIESGLAVARKSGSGQYDRFRDRLIFPIRDIHGKTVAFGGRALGPDEEPKYLNSPESPAYVKGEHLYGLDQARESIRREGYAIVVEGYMDLAALVQAGFHQTVASLGTALTAAQAKLLSRTTQRVIVSYDGDAAGTAAAAKSLGLLLEHGLDVRVVDLPAGLDPDDTIRERGADAYAKLLRTAPGYLEWVLRREVRSRDVERPEDKVAVINAVLPHLSRLTNPIERVAWATRVAEAVALEDRLVLDELKKTLRTAGTSIRTRHEPGPRIAQSEALLVLLLLGTDEERQAVLDQLDPEDLEPGSPVEEIVRVVRTLQEEGDPVEYATVFQALEDDAHRGLLASLAFRDESMDAGLAVDGCLATFRRRRLEREQRSVVDALKRERDPAMIDDLLARKMNLRRRIASLTDGVQEDGAR
jgi:DNA primase